MLNFAEEAEAELLKAKRRKTWDEWPKRAECYLKLANPKIVLHCMCETHPTQTLVCSVINPNTFYKDSKLNCIKTVK